MPGPAARRCAGVGETLQFPAEPWRCQRRRYRGSGRRGARAGQGNVRCRSAMGNRAGGGSKVMATIFTFVPFLSFPRKRGYRTAAGDVIRIGKDVAARLDSRFRGNDKWDHDNEIGRAACGERVWRVW